jgi:Copper type II ascorbate-dependent monooxygenase, C-terminal domain
MKITATFLFCLLFCIAGKAQTITWAKDVAPILYEHCAGCHRDDGIGHFSLIGYGNAYSKRFGIRAATEARLMPPWKPDPAYRRYAHENRLTDAEIALVGKWANNGAPAGDQAQAPSAPVFSGGSSVGTPDHLLKTPLYTIKATEDEYRCFVIPNGLNKTSFLRGLEAIPGNHEAVHHILIYEDTTGQAKALDAQTPNEAGYVNFGGPGVAGARLVGAWAPGSRTLLMPPFMGIRLKAGADLIVQMHYPKGVTGMSDQTTLNFFFTPTNTGIREVRLAPILNHTPLSLQNYPLDIPANAVKTYHARFTMPQNVSFMTVAPHMHLIGRSITSFGVTPQGDTIRFIRINDWDFHWQGGYAFQKVQKIPAGTILHAYATYDNTANNPFQPSNPPKRVTQGEATTDEMMLVYFAFTAYQNGDEHIVLDSTLLSTSLRPDPTPVSGLRLFPNPVREGLQAEYTVLEKTDLQISLTDLYGRHIQWVADKKGLAPGVYREYVETDNLPAGVYFLQINGIWAEKFVKF